MWLYRGPCIPDIPYRATSGMPGLPGMPYTATMRSRTQGCIAMLPTGNLTGSVKMWCLATHQTVIKDQF